MRYWDAQEVVRDMQEVTEMDRLSALRKELAEHLGTERYDFLLVAQTSFSVEDAENQAAVTLRAGSPNQFMLERHRRNLFKPLQNCCRQIWQQDVNIVFFVEEVTDAGTADCSSQETDCPDQESVSQTDDNCDSRGRQGLKRSIGTQRAPESTQPLSAPLERSIQPHRHSTFASFVVGKTNKLAHGTAIIVAEQPGRYCPLLLHGPSGVGKSHLLAAVRQQVRRHTPRANVVGLTSEQFTTQFLEALDRRTLPSFRHKYRTVDVLLVDDIQFLARKRATLEEMLYTIDTLHGRGSQILLASDRPPGELQAVSAELVSRISSGLAVPLDLPDYQVRAGIVRNLALRMQIVLDERVIEMIATQVAGSARQLSGALNRLMAGSMALGKPITPKLAEPALADFIRQNAPTVRLPDIQRAVCEVFGVEPASLKSSRKSRTVAEPRMLAMWLARKYTRSALSEISDFFGRRSHSTVISAQKKVDSLLKQSSEIIVADQPCNMDEAIRRVEAAMRSA